MITSAEVRVGENVKVLTLDIIVPCYQEEKGISKFHEELVKILDSLTCIRSRILYIDDGSMDGTLLLLNSLCERDPRVNVFSFSRNFGHQIAITAGLEVSSADIVIMMDGDLQHPPSLIPVFCERYRDGYDIVSAVRAETEDATWFKHVTSRTFYWMINKLSDMRIEPGAADFCLLSRRVCDAVTRMPEHHRFLRGMIAWVGFPRAFVKFTAPPRSAGASSYTLWKMIRLAADAVFSFSARPIRMILKMGLTLALLGGLYLGYELFRYLVMGDAVRGWPSLVALISVIGGLQIFAIAVSGEYIAMIFEESKRRPLYFFKQRPLE